MRILTFLLLLLALPASATTEPNTGMNIIATFGALIFIIALILFLAWGMKKMRIPALGRHKDFAIIRQLPIGAKERIVIVKAGDEQFLVGVTTQNIQLISKLETPLADGQSGVVGEDHSFAKQLSQLLKKNENT